MVRLLVVIFLGLFLVACGGPVSDTSTGSKVVLKFPDAQRGKLRSSNLDYTQLCYAINITGGEIPEIPPQACDGRYGELQGFVPTGGEVSAEIPFGSNYRLEVIGYRPLGGENSCPNLVEPSLGSLDRSRVYVVGETEFDAQTEEVTVEVQLVIPEVSNHIGQVWSLPQECLPEEDVVPPTQIGFQTVEQTGGKFVVRGQTGFSTMPHRLTGGRYEMKIQQKGSQ